MFDIVDFYPSINVNLLAQALSYAKKFVDISDEDIEVIMHARKSLLFENNNVWCKRDNADLFDVTMGSHDGAEVCELVGLLLLDKLKTIFKNEIIAYIGMMVWLHFETWGRAPLTKLENDSWNASLVSV